MRPVVGRSKHHERLGGPACPMDAPAAPTRVVNRRRFFCHAGPPLGRPVAAVEATLPASRGRLATEGSRGSPRKCLWGYVGGRVGWPRF